MDDQCARKQRNQACSGPLTGHGAGATKTSYRYRFPTCYTRADIELLAQVDEALEKLSGPAPRRIFEREFGQYSKLEFQRLAAISADEARNPLQARLGLCHLRTKSDL
jgi:hypothetical protein